MDYQALRERLANKADLIIGDVAETCSKWTPQVGAPLGMIAFDLDLYSSTLAAFSLLETENILPRVWCYFDDIEDMPESCLTDFVGVPAAINQFNQMPRRNVLRDNLSPGRVFTSSAIESWHRKIYLYHRLSHPLYNVSVYDRKAKDQLSLK